jgi:hypothetical protein
LQQVHLSQSLLVAVVLQFPHIRTQLITVDVPVLQQLLQMVELHQIIPWHPVVLAVMEILAVHQQVNMFQVVAVVLVVLVTEQPAALALTQISLEQHLCTAAAVLDQMDQQEVHLQAAAPMAIHQRQVEVAVVHRPRQVLHLHLQVRMA